MGLPDLDTTMRSRAEQRLATEDIVWITTVRADGQPQASPVGFIWDGTRFLILSGPEAPKVVNLLANPKAALHLDLDRTADDGGVLTIEGVAQVERGPLQGSERSTYLDKYLETIHDVGLTPDEALSELSTVIRITPTRSRAY